jgi:HrpA-like RNA helicase
LGSFDRRRPGDILVFLTGQDEVGAEPSQMVEPV